MTEIKCNAGIPLVSVVIPTYNSEETIERALDSVIGQTIDSFEMLVCDDASTDKTVEIVNEYIKRYSGKIKLLQLQENSGAGAARNLGLKQAVGKFTAFLDADDAWLKNKLEVQLGCQSDNDEINSVMFCGANIYNPEEEKVGTYIPKKNWENDSFKKLVTGEIAYLTPTIMFSTETLKKTGLMIPEMRRGQDGEFLFRLLKESKLRIVEDVLANIYMNTNAAKKKVFKRQLASYKYRAAHYSEVKERYGLLVAKKYKARLHNALLINAIREKLVFNSFAQLFQRLIVYPMMTPKEILLLMRVFIPDSITEKVKIMLRNTKM